MQHAMMNVLDPCFERHSIAHSYACRKGKGTHRAVMRAFDWCRSRRWFLKCDVRKYSDSIDHEILSWSLWRVLKDERVLALLEGLIGSYETGPGLGLPIGNLTSQYFANFHLSALDHHVLEGLGCGAYVRYMDDFVLWHDDKDELRQIAFGIHVFLEDRLRLKLKLAVIGTCAQGLPFLGFLVKPTGIFLLRKTKVRMRSRVEAITKGLEQGSMSEDLAACKARSVNAAALIARSLAFRATIRKGSGLGH